MVQMPRDRLQLMVKLLVAVLLVVIVVEEYVRQVKAILPIRLCLTQIALVFFRNDWIQDNNLIPCILTKKPFNG